MLKYAITLLFLFYFVWSEVSASNEYKDKITNCEKQEGLKFEDLLDNLKKYLELSAEVYGELPMKAFNLCLYKSVGLITKYDEYDPREASKLIQLFFPENTTNTLSLQEKTRITDKITQNCLQYLFGHCPMPGAYEMSLCILREYKNFSKVDRVL
ncbi:uncharacterized protein LOC114331897 [Diabrotica virgifera virgifera]|uniref:Uncharacterized protein LOC114331897 n=1 Tax=Diabrotica virgifera virgifera TaxID=50390 RepID=A0A6P7FMQ3_DIAVI|nr:uncharacterized protein LOC114331897 [Diabrotica virgifera virgifera]